MRACCVAREGGGRDFEGRATSPRPSPPQAAERETRKGCITGDGGFTLVELLVVVGVLAVLAAMLIPALANTQPDGRTFQCLNNERQIVLGWRMYADDNNDVLAPNDYPYRTTIA